MMNKITKTVVDIKNVIINNRDAMVDFCGALVEAAQYLGEDGIVHSGYYYGYVYNVFLIDLDDFYHLVEPAIYQHIDKNKQTIKTKDDVWALSMTVDGEPISFDRDLRGCINATLDYCEDIKNKGYPVHYTIDNLKLN